VRFLLGFISTALAMAQLPSPTLSENTTRISDHVQAIMGFPNVVIVTGDRGTLVVDTGLGPSNGATISRVVNKLARGPKLYLTTTHFHPEHAAGEAGFPAGTILLRPAAQQQEMDEHGPELLKRFSQISPEYAGLLKGVDKLRTPDVIFDSEAKLDLGGTTARLMWLGAAHTKGDELILVEPDSVLISGDVVQNKVVPGASPDGGSFASWLTVLDKLEALKPRLVVPTHSRPGEGSLIAQEHAFIVDMRSRALALKKQGLSAVDAGKRLTEDFKAAYPEWAKNPDWPNTNSVAGFVQRIYAEAAP
jgi:glyoxylase-like metal-dependent hydrolase (beta-lactamase superfamily II)